MKICPVILCIISSHNDISVIPIIPGLGLVDGNRVRDFAVKLKYCTKEKLYKER